MKKLTVFFIVFSLAFKGFAQIITTTPSIVTNDFTGEIEIIYDAALGTAGLKDYTGTDGVYAHTGVITNLSTSDADWKHAPAWGDNAAKYKLTSLGNNKWKLLITPSMAGYYGLTTGEIVKKMAFVFRNGLKTKEGKDTGGKDILVSVFNPGINVQFDNPSTNQTVVAGTNMNISITTNQNALINLIINGAVVKTVADAASLLHTYTFATADDYTLIAQATANGKTVADTVQICVPAPASIVTLPAGVVPGINIVGDSSVVLALHAPNQNNVFLIGEMNNWTQLNAYQLKKDGDIWWIRLDGLNPDKIYGFQYLLANNVKITDPYTEMILDPWNDQWINYGITRYPNIKSYPASKTDGLVATFQINKPAYAWEVSSFPMPERENLVVYEILLRDFTVERTLEAAIAKLDYLKILGITAVELMPVQEFDGNESWGYNPNHYFAPDKAYGNAHMYKKFVDECHKRGIAVLLDVVLNHATGLNPMARMFWNGTANQTAANNPWFNVSAPHPYSVFHDFNHSYAPTREFFKRFLKFWISEYKIDGYRLDLTKGLTQTVSSESTASNYDQSRINILSEYYDAAKEQKNDVMFILEHFCNYDEELVLANKGMYLWRNVNNAFSQASMGYASSSDFGGMVSTPRKWVGYAESHDEERNMYKAKAYGTGDLKTDSIERVGRVPLKMAFSTLLPGPKMIWQFGELGYDYSIDALGGRTSSKPSAWGWLNLTHRAAAYNYTSKILNLRKMYASAFVNGTFNYTVSANDWESGRRISLTHGDLNMVVLGNFKTDGSVTVNPNFSKTGYWYNLEDGTATYYPTTNPYLTLAPGQLLILTDRKIDLINGGDVISESQSVKIYPSLTTGEIQIKAAGEYRVKLYSLQGQMIKEGQNLTTMNLNDMNAGVYLVEVVMETGSVVQKILKQ